MKKFIYLFQELLKFSMIFFIFFIWLNFFISSTWLNSILSLFAALIVEIILFVIASKKKNKENLKYFEKEEAENMFLSLSTEVNCNDFFYNLSKSRHSNVIKNKDYVKIIHHDNTSTILYPFIKFTSLSHDEIANMLKKCSKDKPEKIVIVCGEYDKKSLSFIKNFDIEIVLLDKYETYSLLYKEYEYFPEISVKFKKEKKLNIRDLLAYSFNKSRTKGYIISAIILLISSLFVKINLYYCIITSILLLFALLSFINPKFNIKTKKELL